MTKLIQSCKYLKYYYKTRLKRQMNLVKFG